MTKEIPILFSTPMVQGVDEDRKTITRRTRNLKRININPDKWELSLTMDNWTNSKGEHEDKFSVLFTDKKSGKQIAIPCPYGKAGDILWIRESFRIIDEKVVYKATHWNTDTQNWKPSIHMLKTVCRTFLEVTNIRIERLHDITEKDAIAEGVESYKDVTQIIRFRDYYSDASGYGDPKEDYPSFPSGKESFKSLWKKINGKKSWEKNPWVWVIEFKKVKNYLEQKAA